MTEFDGKRWSTDDFQPLERAQHREMLDRFIVLHPNLTRLDSLINVFPLLLKIGVAVGAFGAAVAWAVSAGVF